MKSTSDIVGYVSEAIHQSRTLARGLHPPGDDPQALVTALAELAQWVRNTSSLSCRFTGSKGEICLRVSSMTNHLYRIAQEAGNNAIRRSGATSLTIRLEMENGVGVLSIKDNGCGLDQHETERLDCLGRRTSGYRAHAIEADPQIRRRRRGGTAVICTFAAE